MFRGRRVLIPLAIAFVFLFVMTLSGFAQTVTPGLPMYPPVNPNPSPYGATQPTPVPHIDPSQPPYSEGSTTTIPNTTNPNPGSPNQPYPYPSRSSPSEVNPYSSPGMVPSVTP